MKKKLPSVAPYDEIYLLHEIEATKAALEIAYQGFDNVVDPDLIDCYIYQVNSIQKRYKFLIGRAREAGLDVPLQLRSRIS